jgi:hypothetical protein
MINKDKYVKFFLKTVNCILLKLCINDINTCLNAIAVLNFYLIQNEPQPLRKIMEIFH